MAKRVSIPTVDYLRELYVVRGLSDRAIGEILAVTDVCVSKWRRRLGIPTLNPIARTAPKGSLPIGSLTDGELRKLVAEGATVQHIANVYGCSVGPIKRRLQQFGIRPPTVEDVLGDLPLALHHVLVGVLLGDGSIGYTTGGRARFGVSHSHKQYGYTRRLHELFGSWATPMRFSVGANRSGRVFPSYGFSTRYHKVFREYRRVWYRDDLRGSLAHDALKAPPLEVFRTLSDESLAYWYFDDGTYGGGTPSIVIHFPLLVAAEVIVAVQTGTGLPWYKSTQGDKLYSISLRVADASEFFNRIVPYATPDLAYKFPSDLHHKITGDLSVPPDIGSMTEARLAHYPVSTWRTLDPSTQDKWVREVLAIYRAIGFPFPPVLQANETKAAIQRLQAQSEVLDEGHVFRRSNVGLSLCNGHMPHRFETFVGGTSAFSTFQDDRAFLGVIRSPFQSPSAVTVSPPSMRGALSVYGGNRTPSNFRPTAMKAIVDAFCPVGGVVYDPCAGFGGRLLGAVSSDKMATYIGTDPSPKTVAGLRRLWEAISPMVGGSPDRVCIRCGTSETEDLPEGSVDLVFTSPPYYHTEKYVGGDQSHILYRTYEEWRDLFLSEIIRRSVRFLKPGGVFGLNIQNVTVNKVTYPLVKDTDVLARSAGLVRWRRAWYTLNRFGKQRPDEPVLFFRKPTTEFEVTP